MRILATEVVGPLTGRDSANRTASRWNVHGTDLGHMIAHGGKLYMVFGDTYGPNVLGIRDWFFVRNWRSNTIARIADPDPRNGLLFEAMIAGPDGMAKEVIPSRKIDGVERTVIPTYGISVDGRMYLHYMSVRRWGRPGHWDVGHSGIAYSDDDGETWSVPADAVWPPQGGFEQVAFVLEEDYLYTFGIPAGRFGGARLRRVVPGRILERDAYGFWDGQQWVADPALATIVVPGPVGEFSVAWSAPRNRWLMLYLDAERNAVMLRSAPDLTGPWGEARVVVTSAEHPGLYAPYIVPGTEIGSELYFTLSRWDVYNVFLMRTTFAPALPTPEVASGIDLAPATGGTVITSEN